MTNKQPILKIHDRHFKIIGCQSIDKKNRITLAGYAKNAGIESKRVLVLFNKKTGDYLVRPLIEMSLARYEEVLKIRTMAKNAASLQRGIEQFKKGNIKPLEKKYLKPKTETKVIVNLKARRHIVK